MSVAYRKEIDGLRCFAVIAVMLFHAGSLSSGFLGVDVFFVISGFLITSLIEEGLRGDTFSITAFYDRRLRRIAPMVVLMSMVALIPGYFLFLPDHLENLGQSVIATLAYANNLLLYLTSGYWDIVNEYKPLMHTWSLGVEMQFYLLFPFILLLTRHATRGVKLILLSTLLLLSLVSNLYMHRNAWHFFMVTSRFFEFAIGALVYYLRPRENAGKYGLPLISLALILVLFFVKEPHKNVMHHLLISVFTGFFIYSYDGGIAGYIAGNRAVTFIGKISYSLYMWHQVVFAYARVVLSEEPGVWLLTCLFLQIFLLSVITYYVIEKPFRTPGRVSHKVFYPLMVVLSLAIAGAAYRLYARAGVVRPVPELNISENTRYSSGWHNEYNKAVDTLNRPFTTPDKQKVLVIGNSFARDFVNMLLENGYGDSLELRYTHYASAPDFDRFLAQADKVIFGSPVGAYSLKIFCTTHHLGMSKVLVVGPKNFGRNNDIFFNRYSAAERCNLRTAVTQDIVSVNLQLRDSLAGKYLDLLALLADKDGKVPVFTPGCKLISQDCRHLTREGAKYAGSLLANDTVFMHFIKR